MIGGEQCIEHRAVDLLAGAGEREVGKTRPIDVNAFLRKACDHRVGGGNDFHSQHAKPVHHRRSAPSGRGHDRDTVSRGRALAENQRGQLEQRLEQLHAQHAIGTEKRFRGVIRAGHRAGVRGGELDAHIGAAELEHDDGLARGKGAARSRAQSLGIAYGFHEKQDDARIGIVHDDVGHLSHREVGLVAD